jgi:hypothetical protein
MESPERLVVVGYNEQKPTDQPIAETTNITIVVSEKKTRKTTKKTKTVPNSSGLCTNKATFRVSSEEAFSPLPVVAEITLDTQISPATTKPEILSPNSTGDILSPSELIVETEALRPDKSAENILTTSLLPVTITKKQTTKKPPANKKTKRGKLNSTIVDNKRNETPPTLQIANIILHLKCSVNDLDVYNDEVNRQLTDPMLYNPTVPPDIMTYQPAEHYSVLEETKPPNNTLENYAYSESKNRVASSNKFCEIETEVPNNPITKTEEEPDTTNMKEINTKLKKLKISLFKNTSFMDKKSACFWCTYDFDNPECYIPRYEMDGTVHGYGSFCRPECAAAYLMKENLDDSTKFERYHLLNQIYSKIYDYKKNIKPSPNPYYLLDKFYGNLTIQEYRKLLKSDHLLLVIDKPLTRILPELHEDNEEFLTSIYGNNTTITGGTNTQSTGATCAKSNTFGVYKVRRQSEKPVGVTKTSIIKEHFGITA